MKQFFNLSFIISSIKIDHHLSISLLLYRNPINRLGCNNSINSNSSNNNSSSTTNSSSSSSSSTNSSSIDNNDQMIVNRNDGFDDFKDHFLFRFVLLLISNSLSLLLQNLILSNLSHVYENLWPNYHHNYSSLFGWWWDSDIDWDQVENCELTPPFSPCLSDNPSGNLF